MTRLCGVCGQPVDQPIRGWRLVHPGRCRRLRDAVGTISRFVAVVDREPVTAEAREALRVELAEMAGRL